MLVVVGFFAYRYFSSYESTDDAQVDGHVNSVSARVSGHVTKLNVQDNQYVQAGTVLVEIDPADYQVAYERAKADFEDAQAAAVAAGVNVPITSVNTTSQVSATEADVNSARAGIQVARQQFEAAKAELQQAEANDVKAQNDLGRYKQLVDKQEISQQQYDQATAAAKASAAGVAAARASADAAQQQVTQAQGKLVQAQANWSNANTAPKQMQITRAKADLCSRRSAAQEGRSRSSRAQLAVHQDRCAGERHRQQSHRRSRPERRSRPGVDEDHQSRRHLDHRELQRDSTARYEGWPARHHRRRRQWQIL